MRGSRAPYGRSWPFDGVLNTWGFMRPFDALRLFRQITQLLFHNLIVKPFVFGSCKLKKNQRHGEPSTVWWNFREDSIGEFDTARKFPSSNHTCDPLCQMKRKPTFQKREPRRAYACHVLPGDYLIPAQSLTSVMNNS